MFAKIFTIATLAVAASAHPADAKSCRGWTCKSSQENQNCPKGVPGASTKSYCCRGKRWRHGACKREKKKAHANFGDLSFLNSEGAFKAAQAAREKFVKEHMRLAAHRAHETMKYFKARHHAGYRHKLMRMFAHKLRARIAAHKHSIRAHHVAKAHSAHAKAKRAKAWKALKAARHHLHHAKKSLRHHINHTKGAHKRHNAARAHLARVTKALHHARRVWAHARKMQKHWRKVELSTWHKYLASEKHHAHAKHHMNKARKAHEHAQRVKKHHGKARAHAHHLLRKAKAAMHRSKMAAIRSHHKVIKHVRKGIMAGHI